MTFAHLYASARLPLWVRVSMYALDHDGIYLDRAQLLHAMDPHGFIRSAEIARAIKVGISRGVLAAGSSSAMLELTKGDHDDGRPCGDDLSSAELIDLDQEAAA